MITDNENRDDKKKDLYTVAQAIVMYIEKADSETTEIPNRKHSYNKIRERIDLIEDSK